MNVRHASGFNILLFLVDVVGKRGSLARGPGFDSHYFQSFLRPSLCVEPSLNLFSVNIIRKKIWNKNNLSWNENILENNNRKDNKSRDVIAFVIN